MWGSLRLQFVFFFFLFWIILSHNKIKFLTNIKFEFEIVFRILIPILYFSVFCNVWTNVNVKLKLSSGPTLAFIIFLAAYFVHSSGGFFLFCFVLLTWLENKTSFFLCFGQQRIINIDNFYTDKYCCCRCCIFFTLLYTIFYLLFSLCFVLNVLITLFSMNWLCLGTYYIHFKIRNISDFIFSVVFHFILYQKHL